MSGAQELDDLVLGGFVSGTPRQDIFELMLEFMKAFGKVFNSSYMLMSRSSKSIAPFFLQRAT